MNCVVAATVVAATVAAGVKQLDIICGGGDAISKLSEFASRWKMATAGSSESYGAEAHYEAVHHGYRQAPLQTIENMLEQEIPKTLFELESSKKNLAQVADHIENAYNTVASTPNTREAFQQAQQYTIQALASVAYQVNAASSCLLQTLAVQDENIRLLGTELAGPRRVSQSHSLSSLFHI